MSQYKYDGFAVKNQWGSILFWSARSLKREVIKNLGAARWKDWKKDGAKIVKIKLLEVGN